MKANQGVELMQSQRNEHQALSGTEILLVDDSTDNLHLFQRILTGAGAKVVTAENGAQAIERILEKNYDVVIMDIQMPVMDGYTAAQLMRAKGYQRPIIALTAHHSCYEPERSVRAGFSHYYLKPISRTKLIEAVQMATPVL